MTQVGGLRAGPQIRVYLARELMEWLDTRTHDRARWQAQARLGTVLHNAIFWGGGIQSMTQEITPAAMGRAGGRL